MTALRTVGRARRAAAVVLTVLAGTALATSCSTTTTPGASVTRPAVDANLTRDGAQAQMVTHFTEVLAHAPTSLSLALAAPKPTLQAQEKGITVPCYDDNTVHDSPVNLQVDFWVQGIPDGDETTAYHALVRAFTDAGWSTTPDETTTDKITRAYTPDGYALELWLNSVGGLSLGASSPCFPATHDTTTTPQPTAIPHPTS